MAEDKKVAQANWKDVQAELKTGNAAAELLRFPFRDGRKWTGNHAAIAMLLIATFLFCLRCEGTVLSAFLSP
jgi:hypothetical protein